ncbi:hypothetical protein Lfu02_42550 [Longispora fulva]|uniref:Uncharacterized protein n=1 Tax=Longispora fulva TaxID=619741 RepID=A0A8J7GAB3_9ACTN|nr:hypothetical protein [Longispora fulva]MBG6136713.1 hypothetical protein [Longispora fulva]GIG59883.1 hypothetical protein Lfu02_42550 [Longispora fulva]
MDTVTTPVRIPAHHTLTRRLGHWTTEREFQVRAHRGAAVLDLRSPQIPAGDIHIDVDLDRAMLKLLVAEDAVIDDWNLHRVGRGRIKDWERPTATGGRRIVITGRLAGAEIRVHRGGIAILSAMFTREYWADLRRAHRQGGYPTVDDPTRTS